MKSLLVLCAIFGVYWTEINGSCIADGDRNINGANVTKQIISDAIWKFTLEQYKTMLAQNGSTNIFASPYSIWTALANAYLGSRGTSSEELGTVLGLEAYDKADVEQAMLGLAEDVISETGDKFLVANKFAFSDIFKIRKCLVGDSFEVESMNFTQDPTGERKRINSWVSSKTEEKIEELLPEGSIDSLTLLIILNAVYFQGSWAVKFDKTKTSKKPFYSQNGDTNNVDMMFRHVRTSSYWDPNSRFTAIDLPYLKGKYAMSVILPLNSNTVDNVLNYTTVDSLKNMFNGFHKTKLPVSLPKFQLETSYKLQDTLESLGTTKMFKSIDISGIMETYGPNVYVKQVYHSAFVKVDEEGTEAAAATAVSFDTRIRILPFNVNKPFIVIIREISANTVMFVGVIKNL